MKKHFARLLILMFLFSCESEIIFEEIIPKNQSLPNTLNLRTVPLEITIGLIDSIQSFKRENLGANSVFSSSSHSFNLNVYKESLRQVQITNSNALINIVDASTSLKDVESQVIQLEINGSMQTVLHNYVQHSAAENLGNSRDAIESVFITDLEGKLLNWFIIENRNLVGEVDLYNELNFTWIQDVMNIKQNSISKGQSTNPYNAAVGNFPRWPYFCAGCIHLSEVVVYAQQYQYARNTALSYLGNTSNIYNQYQFQRSLNNYSTLGTAYANFFNSDIAKAFVIDSPDDPINDIKKYLECFDTSNNAILTVYVDQPIAGKKDAYTGFSPIVVGHTFISIAQGNNVMVFGFYPDGDPNPIYPSAPGIFGNDQGGSYDVSVSVPISGRVLGQIISLASSYGNYNLNTNNCSDFGIEAGNLAGLNLPDSYGSWRVGGGSNPGALGENIRENSTPGVTKNTNGGNAPMNQKDCTD